jgi:signal transduction histidine kinase
MKASRSLLIWATLALCGVMVLGAMTWLTRGVLASEKNRAEAEARADLEERTRLALWRMDTAGSAILLRENQRPPSDFQARRSDPGWNAAGDPLVNLHFEVRSGSLVSPEVDDSAPRLQVLRELLSKNGDIASLLNRAAAVSEEAWKAMPKDAPELQSRIAESNKSDSGSKRASQAYQEDSSRIEKVQRAKVVESQEVSAAVFNENLKKPSNPEEKIGEILEISSMRSVWIDAELLLLRSVTVRTASGNSPVIQGVWLDAAKIEEHLLKEATDLLPSAGLERLIVSADDPMALASFPFRLQRNSSINLPSPAWGKPLVIGWVAVVIAILTASLLVHGVMRLSERRASFVSAVTHELRTPLTTFRLYSDMLESGAVKPEKRGDYLRVLSREADRLSHLVENVLSFSRIERGSARSVVREAAISDLLETMRERLEARLATAGMTLEMDSSCKLRVRVDSAAVEHILFNLIDNAAKYASSGKPPAVVIKVRKAGGNLEIIVSDHGPGIPVSERRRIFRAFHKSAREAAESRPGVGLGLALSRRLAKSLGGGLECVDSKQGACFVLRLPLA